MEWIWIAVWACVIAAAIIIEIETFSLVSAWFAGGAIVPLILAMINTWTAASTGWVWQVIVFVVVSLGLLLGCRPFAKKFIKSPTVPTNADSYLGKKYKLLSDVKHGRSTISINDVVWTVQVDCDCQAGESVILKEISGNKYIAECAKTAEAKKSVTEDAEKETAAPVKKKGGK